MIVWLDAQLPPAIADWISKTFNITCTPVRDLGLRDALDKKIFNEAKKAGAVVITKDIDFSILQQRFGPPPKIIWLTCGNTSNKRLKEIFTTNLEKALNLLFAGENMVEIKGEF
jgi:predicted nuclease of predicted toxin-antitoxin system